MVQFLCLKMMEDWIFYRWNHIEREEKLFIREGVMKLFDYPSIYNEMPAARTKYVQEEFPPSHHSVD